MATNFPAGLDVLPNPVDPGAGQYVWQDGSIRDGIGPNAKILVPANPDLIHENQHANANAAILALENKVGVDGSDVTTSLDYLLKNPLSADPGHKHNLASGSITGILPIANGRTEFAKQVANYTLNQAINALTDYTWTIALANSNFTHGFIFIQNTNGTFINPTGVYIAFTTNTAEAAGIASFLNYSAYGAFLDCAILHNSVGGFVAGGTSFGSSSTAPTIAVKSARINGANLEVVFRNTGASSQTVTCSASAAFFTSLRNSTP